MARSDHLRMMVRDGWRWLAMVGDGWLFSRTEHARYFRFAPRHRRAVEYGKRRQAARRCPVAGGHPVQAGFLAGSGALRPALPVAAREQRRPCCLRHELRGELALRRRAHRTAGAPRRIRSGSGPDDAWHRRLRADGLGAAHGACGRARMRGDADAASVLLQRRVRRRAVSEFRRDRRAGRRFAPARLPVPHPAGVADSRSVSR